MYKKPFPEAPLRCKKITKSLEIVRQNENNRPWAAGDFALDTSVLFIII